MDNYIDDKYSILDGVLIACRDRGRNIEIPASVNGHRIRRIGNGCSVDVAAGTVSVAEGIEELGHGGLCMGNPYAEMLYLPASLTIFEDLDDYLFWSEYTHVCLKRRLPRDEFEIAEQASLRLENGFRLLDREHGGTQFFKGMSGDIWNRAGYNEKAPAGYLSNDMYGLYMIKQPAKNSRTTAINRDGDYLKQFVFYGNQDMYDTSFIYDHGKFRKNIIKALLGKKSGQIYTNRIELENDRKNRPSGKTGSMPNVLLIYYGEDDIYYREDDRNSGKAYVTVNIHMECGRVFFPMLKKIVISGKDYYLYTENFLQANEDRPFIRVEFPDEIYDGSGRKAGTAVADQVMAKYRLASMLT